MTGAETVLLIGAIVSASAAAYGGVSAYQQGQAQSKAAKVNADYARQLGERNAQVATQQAKAQADQIREDRQRRLAILSTEISGSGISMTGTPISLLAEQTAIARTDVQMARYNGRVRAQEARYSGSISGYNYDAQAQQYAMAGQAGLVSGLGKAGGTLLSGYGDYLQAQEMKG